MTGSHLVLRPATAEEYYHIVQCHFNCWAGGLDIDSYRDRELALAATPLARNGGLRIWVLVDPTNDPPVVLSSCETLQKEALISRPSADGKPAPELEQVKAFGIGSVFTPEEHRKNGYAGVMLRQLGRLLMTTSGNSFSVLYSDIGKKFYANMGWLPHPSSHVEIPAMEHASASELKYLRCADIPALCEKDIVTLRETLSRSAGRPKTRVAFLPDYKTLEWLWAREEFVGARVRKHIGVKPDIKGVMTADGKCWMLWTRDFNRGPLCILRYVNLSGDGGESEEEQVVTLLQAAAFEAHKWELKKVTLWNPDEICVKAAERVAGVEAKIIDREEESICSLRMHNGGGSVEEVDWIINEKFAWC